MKRFWLVLLSLGLIMAFSASAFAVDVKFSGSYFAAGLYLDKANLAKSNNDNQVASAGATAFYFQKLQLKTEFVAAPGVSLVTRANIMERVWGGPRSGAGAAGYGALDSVGGSAATRAENENIGFDLAYINYASPIGQFLVGYQADSVWGTTFANSETARGKITYVMPIGNWAVGAAVTKYADNSYTQTNNAAFPVDGDSDKYSVFVRYAGKSVEGGLLVNYYNDATTGTVPAVTYKGQYWNVDPYVKAKVGPVAIQAELSYFVGNYRKYYDGSVGGPNGSDTVGINSLSGWIDAIATFGPVYVGGTFAYAQGPSTNTDQVTNRANGGRDWSPTLIMFNYDRSYWIGNLAGNANSAMGLSGTSEVGAFSNAWLYQLKGGVKPTDKLDIGLAVTYAYADNLNNANNGTAYYQNQTGINDRGLGWEIDVTGSYKITNNLSYLLGFGYLFTGNYFKGDTATNPNAEVNNDYIVLNKLTFTF
ncbi:MAG: hypothetical protein ABFD50_19105 [Smithella sp.]